MLEFLSSNWSYTVIALLAIDKVVALSPPKWDDLLWTVVKKGIKKAVRK